MLTFLICETKSLLYLGMFLTPICFSVYNCNNERITRYVYILSNFFIHNVL